ncbi:GNAT family N-acetyltransferase [Streptomyces violarus]|uniref:GNAT family N-acetyltransferase n=1 Tax=Streptomyces violarus TaxID=67380 RepID=UPI0021BF9CC7|nr:GNAT family N-acetyltransferase [Streptomyces violarus]MCT9143679.1 GNAT family N-acetyltransferase [Streptomyces violarus]
MVTLEPLRADHADALLAFERENRAYFCRTVPDRGDVYFTAAGFAERHRSLLAEQHARVCRFHVVLEEGNLIGRVNLMDVADGSAELGYRVGERAAGRGVATAAVAQVCRLAATDYGLTSLTAVTTLDNPASMTVLARNGFTRVEDTTVDGRPGVRCVRRHLDAGPESP